MTPETEIGKRLQDIVPALQRPGVSFTSPKVAPQAHAWFDTLLEASRLFESAEFFRPSNLLSEWESPPTSGSSRSSKAPDPTQREIRGSRRLEDRAAQVTTSSVLFEWEQFDDMFRDVFRSLSVESSLKDTITNFVTLSGSGDDFECATCSDILEKYWGSSGADAIRLFCNARRSPIARYVVGELGPSVKYVATPENLALLRLGGDERAWQKLVAAIRWMCAAIRPAPYEASFPNVSRWASRRECGTHLWFSRISERHVQLAGQELQFIALDPLEEMPVTGVASNCWVDFFHGLPAVEARPRSRSWGRGLELSFDLMVRLASVENYCVVDGGAILLGFFTALVPTAINRNTKSIQWHYESVDKAKRQVLLPSELLKRMQRYDWQRVAPEDMHGTTCFVGWHTYANIMLGTKPMVSSQAPMNWTRNLKECKKWLCSDGYEVGGQIGAPIPSSPILKFAKSYTYQECAITRVPLEDYRDALRSSCGKVCLLIDSESKQAWLVPLLSVVLHLCHRYHKLRKAPGEEDPIPVAIPSPKADRACFEAMKDHGDLAVFGGDDGFPLRGLFHRLLVGLLDHPRRTSSSELLANELMDLVANNKSYPKRIKTSTVSGHFTSDLLAFANAVDAIGVGANIGLAIAPVPVGAETCQCDESCDRLPRMHGYLAAHMSSLGVLCKRAGHSLDDLMGGQCTIANDVYWLPSTDPWITLARGHSVTGSVWANMKLTNKILQEVQVKTRWRRNREGSRTSIARVPGAGVVVFGRPS